MIDNNYYSREAVNARRKLRRKRILIRRIIRFVLSLILIVSGITATVKITTKYISDKNLKELRQRQLNTAETLVAPQWVEVDLIEKHGSARTGKKLTGVSNIIIHYVGNPGTTAKNNRDYFNSDQSDVSSHFVVGLDGEIIQCIPLNEKSAASNWRNSDSISIEVCHPDETGKFNDITYNSVIKLTAWLCNEFELESDDVIRHYDVTEKLCPLYYVENPEEWKQLIKDVDQKMEENKP